MVYLIASLIALALLGAIDAGYLIWKRTHKQQLVCPIGGHECNIVVESKWSTTFGIKNDTLGFLFYLSLIAIGFILVRYEILLLIIGLFIISFFAMVFSLYLTYVQKYILKEYCFYCLLSALINVLIFANSLLLLRG